MARPELGRDVLLRFAESLSDVSSIEAEPKLDGRQMFMLLAPKNSRRIYYGKVQTKNT